MNVLYDKFRLTTDVNQDLVLLDRFGCISKISTVTMTSNGGIGISGDVPFAFDLTGKVLAPTVPHTILCMRRSVFNELKELEEEIRSHGITSETITYLKTLLERRDNATNN